MSYLFLLLIALLVAAPFVIEWNRKPMDAHARRQAPGQFAMLSQGVTHYEWYGPSRGPVLVCIHGLTTPSFVWRRLLQGLALMGFRVLSYDHYGRGFSDRPKGRQSRDFFVQHLDDLLAHEGLEETQISLMGYSMGGAIAAIYAARHPARIRRVILLAPAGMGHVASGFVKFIVRTPFVGDWLMLAAYPDILRKGIRAEGDAEIGALQLRELDYRGFVPAVLSSLRGVLSGSLGADHESLVAADIPVQAIWGRDDDVIPLSASDQLAVWNLNAKQDIVDGAGHGLTYTHADQVLGHLRAFVDQS